VKECANHKGEKYIAINAVRVFPGLYEVVPWYHGCGHKGYPTIVGR